jgi:hypothetical protein
VKLFPAISTCRNAHNKPEIPKFADRKKIVLEQFPTTGICVIRER